MGQSLGWEASSRPSERDSERRFALRLKACLKSNRAREAVQLFMDGVAHELVPDRPDLARWLMQVVGRAETLRLAKAFALKECFYCKSGLERCDACDGRGYHRDRTICERCVGVGAAACDFCTGSGWVTYNYVPAGLRLPVIVARAKAATGLAQALLRKTLPNTSGQGTREGRKALAKELVQLNRLMGVLENAVVASEKLTAGDPEAEPSTKKLTKTCRSIGRKLLARTRQVLRALADTAQADSVRAAGATARALAARRAKFYETLVASEDFLGTGLHHPHLQEQHETPHPTSAPPPPPEAPPEAQS